MSLIKQHLHEQMTDISYIENQIDRIIERLKDAIIVNYEAPSKEDQGYPFAAGYSRSAMQGTIEDLNHILTQLRAN